MKPKHVNGAEPAMDLTPKQKNALYAYFAWHLGDSSWADEVIAIIESRDPIQYAEDSLLDGETVAEILASEE